MSRRMSKSKLGKNVDRRTLIKAAGAGAAVAAFPRITFAQSAGRPIKIGMVAPLTGGLAAFAEADPFILNMVRAQLKGGLNVGGKIHPITIIEKDSQSSSSRAAEVASDLIVSDRVDLMVTSNTADTVNPVADQCEANEVPCISTDTPWDPYFFGRGGTPAKGFDYTYHFFWGLSDLISVYFDMWNSLPTNRVVAAMWPNDVEGNANGDAKTGFPSKMPAAKFTLVDPGRYPPGAQDFSAQIAKFKAAKAEIVVGVMTPPDFTTFWNQAKQQGFHPKICSMAKAILFPSVVTGLGAAGQNLSSGVWWSPNHPFTSTLIPNLSAKSLCDQYMAASKKQWTQPIGFKLALFEVASDVLKRTKNVDDRKSIMEAIRATNVQTIVGPVKWSGQPVKNVCTTPLVGGQWVKGKQFPYDLLIVNNQRAPMIPTTGKLQPIA